MCPCNCNYVDHFEHHDSSQYHDYRRVRHYKNYHFCNYYVCPVRQPIQWIPALRQFVLRVGSTKSGHPVFDWLPGR